MRKSLYRKHRLLRKKKKVLKKRLFNLRKQWYQILLPRLLRSLLQKRQSQQHKSKKRLHLRCSRKLRQRNRRSKLRKKMRIPNLRQNHQRKWMTRQQKTQLQLRRNHQVKRSHLKQKKNLQIKEILKHLKKLQVNNLNKMADPTVREVKDKLSRVNQPKPSQVPFTAIAQRQLPYALGVASFMVPVYRSILIFPVTLGVYYGVLYVKHS